MLRRFQKQCNLFKPLDFGCSSLFYEKRIIRPTKEDLFGLVWFLYIYICIYARRMIQIDWLRKRKQSNWLLVSFLLYMNFFVIWACALVGNDLFSVAVTVLTNT